MNEKGTLPTLTDPKGLGGIIAVDGFDYQLWDGLARIPAWLLNPAFEQIIFEGLEDLEARFFAPQSPHRRLVERFQAKSANLQPAQVREVLNAFQDFERAFPNIARVQTLVTPRLPLTLAWLGRDPARVRKARPFYAPFAAITAASDAKLTADLEGVFGTELGKFVAQSVEFCEQNLPSVENASQAFGSALDQAFPSLGASSRQAKAAFNALCEIARGRQGQPLTRGDLIETIERALGENLPFSSSFALHLRSDRNEENVDAMEISATEFSGASLPYPPPSKWSDDLILPLSVTAEWLRKAGVSRVSISGSYRLTTAVALGWALRAANGFELEIPTRSGSWSTDDRPTFPNDYPEWRVREPSRLMKGEIVVSIGVLRDPSTDLPATAGVSPDSILSLHLDSPITDAKAAQSYVASAKRVIDAEVARLRPAAIRLYAAGPAAFAVALGHRWNAMPPTQLHEFRADAREYVASARL